MMLLPHRLAPFVSVLLVVAMLPAEASAARTPISSLSSEAYALRPNGADLSPETNSAETNSAEEPRSRQPADRADDAPASSAIDPSSASKTARSDGDAELSTGRPEAPLALGSTGTGVPLWLDLPPGGEIEVDPVERAVRAPSSIARSIVRPAAEDGPALSPIASAGSLAAPTAPLEVPMTALELRARSRVSVERYDLTLGEWVLVCVAPCRADVPRGSQLRVPRDRGHDVPGLKRLRLDEARSEVKISVRGGSLKQSWAGVGVSLLSLTGVIAGAGMLYATREHRDSASRTDESVYLIAAASVMLAIGVGITIAGRSRIRAGRPRRTPRVPGAIAF